MSFPPSCFNLKSRIILANGTFDFSGARPYFVRQTIQVGVDIKWVRYYNATSKTDIIISRSYQFSICLHVFYVQMVEVRTKKKKRIASFNLKASLFPTRTFWAWFWANDDFPMEDNIENPSNTQSKYTSSLKFLLRVSARSPIGKRLLIIFQSFQVNTTHPLQLVTWATQVPLILL